MNDAGAIEHLHQPVIDPEDQENHREDELDQDHSFQSRFDLDPAFVRQFHDSLFQLLQILDDFVDLFLGELRLWHDVVEAVDDLRVRVND